MSGIVTPKFAPTWEAWGDMCCCAIVSESLSNCNGHIYYRNKYSQFAVLLNGEQEFRIIGFFYPTKILSCQESLLLFSETNVLNTIIQQDKVVSQKRYNTSGDVCGAGTKAWASYLKRIRDIQNSKTICCYLSNKSYRDGLNGNAIYSSHYYACIELGQYFYDEKWINPEEISDETNYTFYPNGRAINEFFLTSFIAPQGYLTSGQALYYKGELIEKIFSYNTENIFMIGSYAYVANRTTINAAYTRIYYKNGESIYNSNVFEESIYVNSDFVLVFNRDTHLGIVFYKGNKFDEFEFTDININVLSPERSDYFIIRYNSNTMHRIYYKNEIMYADSTNNNFDLFGYYLTFLDKSDNLYKLFYKKEFVSESTNSFNIFKISHNTICNYEAEYEENYVYTIYQNNTYIKVFYQDKIIHNETYCPMPATASNVSCVSNNMYFFCCSERKPISGKYVYTLQGYYKNEKIFEGDVIAYQQDAVVLCGEYAIIYVSDNHTIIFESGIKIDEDVNRKTLFNSKCNGNNAIILDENIIVLNSNLGRMKFDKETLERLA
jgi:hypothetical protein